MKICPNCNQTNPSIATFCQQCASSLTNAQTSQSPPFSNPPPSNQPGWNPPNFGNQPMTPPVVANAVGGASQRAMLAAGLAAFGFCCCFAGGVPAAILGWLEISAIKEGKSSAEGMLMAQIGLWGGIGGAVLNAISWVIALFVLRVGSY
jgi:hypothetical protein